MELVRQSRVAVAGVRRQFWGPEEAQHLPLEAVAVGMVKIELTDYIKYAL
jgi:hypothetical protein